MPRRAPPERSPEDDASGPKPSRHAWAFSARFRARAFGWKGTKLATERLKEALGEIKAVHRTDPVLAAEGAVRLIEKLVPAIQDIDSSSGSLGAATNRALDALVPWIAAAPAPPETRAAWLERLWQAYLDDGYGYLDPLPDRWGELCAAAEIVVQALVDLGRPEDALRYAETRTNPDDHPAVAVACERILRDLGRTDEAYARYGLAAHRGTTNVATFQALAKAYPAIPRERLLADLVAEAPGEEGKWFATAKELALYDRAIDLANRSPCDPKTLIRAARDFEEAEPLFALKCALTALRWLCAGHGYDLVGNEVYAAFDHALRAAERVGERAAALTSMATLLAPERGPRNWAGDALQRLVARTTNGGTGRSA